MSLCVQRISDINLQALQSLLRDYGLEVELVGAKQPIPGSYWGEPEAGLIKNRLYLRLDTPVHSALHEACHWICMDDVRKYSVHTDAKGTVEEECAVNYLQILLAEKLTDVGRERMLDDMTTWGYSYREGSVRAWLQGDGIDALKWLQQAKLVNQHGRIVKQT